MIRKQGRKHKQHRAAFAATAQLSSHFDDCPAGNPDLAEIHQSTSKNKQLVSAVQLVDCAVCVHTPRLRLVVHILDRKVMQQAVRATACRVTQDGVHLLFAFDFLRTCATCCGLVVGL